VTDLNDDPRPTAARVRPRIRTAAIVWGLIVAAAGAGVAWFVLDSGRVTSTGLVLLAGQPQTLAIGAVALVLVVGVVIVIGSFLSVLHRAQDRGRARREERTAASADPGAPAADRT
jgi:uncharacterized membrane protein